jgi:hypothetical protein
MKILCDFHHRQLWKSMQLLLVDRLGYELYRPKGMEWFEQGYWQHEKFFRGDDLAKHFLLHEDLGSEAITVEEARDIDIDWMVATVPGNVLGFRDFADESGAKLAQQVGNNEHFVPWTDVDVVLDSTLHTPASNFTGKYVRYNQEIDRRYLDLWPVYGGTVSSFLNVWHRDQAGLEFFDRVAAEFPGRFRLYGDHGQILAGDDEVIPALAETSIVWHTKRIGDGWGHTLHSSMAARRPIISVNSFYKDMRGEALLKDNPGVLNIEGMDISDVVKNIRWILDSPDDIDRMGMANRERFNEVVNYEADAQAVKEALEA